MPELQSFSDFMSRFGLRTAPYRGDDQKEQTGAHLRSTVVGETAGEARWSVVTVRVTTLKGVDAGRYYTERLPSYYLKSGKARGDWWGAGCRPSSPERRARTGGVPGDDGR
jgi:hypothetical protein